MHDRRGGRPSHVRPRTPSTGRPIPAKARPVKTSSRSRSLPVERSTGLPLLTRLLLAAAVMALVVAVWFTASGGLGRVMTSFGATVSDAIDDLTATPTPKPTVAVVAEMPIIEAPDEPYTNQPAVDLVLTVPGDVVGDSATVVRLYLALPEQRPAPIKEVPVGGSSRIVIPGVELTDGRNDFTATLRGPAGESEPSPVVTWYRDEKPPGIILAAPTDGQTINRAAATLQGRTQGRSTLVARNESNAASATVTAAADGTFELIVPLAAGRNGITVMSTDPAGNVGTLVLSVTRGDGKLAAALHVEPFRFDLDGLPREVELAVRVLDPDGNPLPGALVDFQLQVPGVRVIVSSTTETSGEGRAVFRTTVPDAAHVGPGIANVLVRTSQFGETSDSVPIAVVE